MRIYDVARALTLTALATAGPAAAVDGVIEINQASALAGSLEGDEKGFPVQITQPGSYRLTSDLDVPRATNGIDITSSDVTLDLNGFAVRGSGSHDEVAVGVDVDAGVGVTLRNVEVRNGAITAFDSDGVFVVAGTREMRVIGVRVIGNGGTGLVIQAEGSLIRDCVVTDNDGVGIRAFPAAGSLLLGNVVFNNTGVGIELNSVGWGQNVVAQNNGGNANPQVFGIFLDSQLPSNVCGTNTTCP